MATPQWRLKQADTQDTPETGYTTVYAKSDGRLYYHPEGGSETPLEGVPDYAGASDGDTLQISSGSPAWAAASGGTSIEAGTTFPATPTSGDYFFHTGHDGLFRYSGTTWEGVGSENTGRKNYLFNGAMAVQQRGASGTTDQSASPIPDVYTVDRWAVECGGANGVNWQISTTTVPSNNRSKASLGMTGNAQVTACLLRQRLEARDTPQEQVVFSAWVYNNTGVNLTPTLKVATPSAEDNWTTHTERLSQALTTIADASWERVSHTFDAGSLTDIGNGMEIGLDFGALTAGTVFVTQCQLERGELVTSFEHVDYASEVMRCKRYYNRITFSTALSYIAPAIGNAGDGSRIGVLVDLLPMRVAPSMEHSGHAQFNIVWTTHAYTTSVSLFASTPVSATVFADHSGNMPEGTFGFFRNKSIGDYLAFYAEL